jgi:hypothetical protein
MPNWLGVTENAVRRAQKMAGDKYVAFVGCMYGEGKTCQGPPTSQEWMMAVRADRVEGRKRVNAALATMMSEADKRGIGDGRRKAAVGFCFGGGNVLELARSGADVNAVVCLHGDLVTTMPAKKGDIKGALFVIHGADARFRRPAALLRRGGDHDEGHRRVRRARRAPDLPDGRRLHRGRVQQQGLTVRSSFSPLRSSLTVEIVKSAATRSDKSASLAGQLKLSARPWGISLGRDPGTFIVECAATPRCGMAFWRRIPYRKIAWAVILTPIAGCVGLLLLMAFELIVGEFPGAPARQGFALSKDLGFSFAIAAIVGGIFAAPVTLVVLPFLRTAWPGRDRASFFVLAIAGLFFGFLSPLVISFSTSDYRYSLINWSGVVGLGAMGAGSGLIMATVWFFLTLPTADNISALSYERSVMGKLTNIREVIAYIAAHALGIAFSLLGGAMAVFAMADSFGLRNRVAISLAYSTVLMLIVMLLFFVFRALISKKTNTPPQ